jgi:hypothetical protein
MSIYVSIPLKRKNNNRTRFEKTKWVRKEKKLEKELFPLAGP